MANQPDKLKPALYGGLIIGLISAVPGLNFLNCFCCAGVLLGGAMAVFFYKNQLGAGTMLTSADCIKLGALAGLIGAVIYSILGPIFAHLLLGQVTPENAINLLEKFGIELPPGTLDELKQALGEAGKQAFSFTTWVISLIISAVIDTLFGLLGGLIGYAIWKPKTAQDTTKPSSQ